MVDLAPVHEASHMGGVPLIWIILEQEAQRMLKARHLHRHRAPFAEKE